MITMLQKKPIWILVMIIVVALFLRTYKISTNPPALSWDEVSIGYNAYSILKTGRDEHGRFFPLDAFAAYGDYKPPLAVYLTVPSIAAFGLNEFGVRFPSALFGTLTVLLTYGLIIQLFQKEKYSHLLAGISSTLLALSPWHINLSRAGFEGNIAVFFLVLGVYLILVGRERRYARIVGWIPFVLAVYTFNSSRYFAPILALLSFIFVHRSQTYLKDKQSLFVGWMLAVVLILPILPHILSPESRLRFQEVNIFSDVSVIETANERIADAGGGPVAKLIHNRRIGYLKSFVGHYLDHFEPYFLFISGDGNPKFSIQEVGQLYIIEAPFLVIGVYALFASQPPVAWFLLLWLLFSIIPAGVARETPHALRTATSLPTWHIFIGYGVVSSLRWIRGRRGNRRIREFGVMGVMGVIGVIYVGSVGYYLHNYYNHYPRQYSGEWQYGYKQAIQYMQEIQDEYDTVVITDSIGRPYMYTLFYTKYDSDTFRSEKQSTFDAAGFYHVYSFGGYEFVRNGPDEFNTSTLYILAPQFVPENAHVLDEIRLLNGQPVLTVFDMR